MASVQDQTEERNSRFLALLKPIQGDCERWAYRLAGNEFDAQDILATSIHSALAGFGNFRGDGSVFKKWMFRIIRRAFYETQRSAHRVPVPVDPVVIAGQQGSGAELAEVSERGKTVQVLLSRLSTEQREAIWLFEVEGFSSQEIAQVLGKQDGAVRVLLKRARERLMDLLREAGIGPA